MGSYFTLTVPLFICDNILNLSPSDKCPSSSPMIQCPLFYVWEVPLFTPSICPLLQKCPFFVGESHFERRSATLLLVTMNESIGEWILLERVLCSFKPNRWLVIAPVFTTRVWRSVTLGRHMAMANERIRNRSFVIIFVFSGELYFSSCWFIQFHIHHIHWFLSS